MNETKMSNDMLKLDDSFDEIGFDSILAMNINQELEITFGELTKTLLFEYPTLCSLASYFLENHEDKVVQLFGKQKKQMEQSQPPQTTVARETKIFEKPIMGKPSFDKLNRMKKENKDIAIIGISGKFPLSPDLETFWENLKKGTDCITEIPKNRWSIEEYYTEDKNQLGKMYCKWGGFLDDMDKFDPLFFNISPREAEIMDPQERLFLQCAYSAMEDAGYTRRAWEKNRVGVFVGVMYGQYQMMEAYVDDKPLSLSSVYASIANRVSYHLNLHGPSIALDTMCSSSLSSVHLACESIKRGESDYAIAGGVNLTIHPGKYVFLSQQKFMASDGRCRSFGKGGDGYVPGEGVGALILKSIDQAIADGDHIYGVIKGSALNHGGKTSGYTVPNPMMQTDVIEEAIKEAKIDPRTINYIEAHGTGTSLGDPIEVSGLVNAFKKYTKETNFCALGSVKSNIGHCESAAGVASILKVLLQMQYKMLVPSLHSETLNENINFERTPFYVQRECTHWEPVRVRKGNRIVDVLRRAGISAFGAGGANAHIILEEYPEKISEENNELQVIPISARNQNTLREYIKLLFDYLNSQKAKTVSLAQIAGIFQNGREEFACRIALLASNQLELRDVLECYLNKGIKNGFVIVGNVNENEAYRKMIGTGEESKSFIQTLIHEKNIEKLANLWVNGVTVPWKELGYFPCEKISVPSYPFEKKRYWIAEYPTRQKKTVDVISEPGLLQYNLSGLKQVIFGTSLSYLKHSGGEYKIGEKSYYNSRILLSMVLEALSKAGVEKPLSLQNVAWSDVTFPEDTKDFVKIFLSSQGERIFCEVVQDGGEILLQCETVLSELMIAEKSEKLQSETYHTLTFPKECTTDSEEVLKAIWELLLKEYVEKDGNTMSFSMSRFVFTKNVVTELTVIIKEKRQEEQMQYDIYVRNDKQLVGEVEGLVFCAVDDQATDLANIFYTTAWEESALPQVQEIKDKILLFMEEERLIETGVKAFGDNAVYVVNSQASLREGMYGLDFSQEDAFVSLIEMLKEQGVSFEHIIYFVDSEQEFGEKEGNSALSLFYLAKACLKVRISGNMQLLCVYEIKDSALDASMLALSGMMKTLGFENPKMKWKTVGAETLDAKMLHVIGKTEFQDMLYKKVQHQTGHRYIQKAQRYYEPTSSNGITLKEGGVYLIIGGTGGLGKIFSQYLAKKYHATLILTGRSPQNDKKKVVIDSLLKETSKVSYVESDLGNLKQTVQLLKELKDTYGQINGIFACAGEKHDSFVLKKTSEEFLATVTSKVTGAVNLDLATRDYDVDFIVYFSSITGETGNLGQADYAYANGFLNEYVNHHKPNHQKLFSIAWPLWKSEGMHISKNDEERLKEQTGLVPISQKKGLQAFERMSKSGHNFMFYAYGKEVQICEMMEPDLVKLTSDKDVLDTKPLTAGDDKKEEAKKYLIQLFSEILKIPEEEFNEQVSFEDYGIESVVIGYINERLEKDFSDISKTLMFEYQTIAELAEYLAKHYGNYFHQSGKLIDIKEEISKKHSSPQRTWRPLKHDMEKRNIMEEKHFIDEDIAIIGINGKYPMAGDVNEFWENISQEKDCITTVPLERWDYKQYFDENYEKPVPGKMYSKWGGFIADVDKFDPAFFGIAPREAVIMDPQERIFLETVWGALEDSGYPPKRMKQQYDGQFGAQVGVFVGETTLSYQMIGAQEWEKGNLSCMPNVSPWSIANRVSYLLNLCGPSIPVDTACSSSMTAIYLACESLKNGECQMAIAGGVNLYLHPYKYVLMCQNNMLSPTGHCHSFSDQADGFVPGEGVGALVLKPLSEAVKDQDFIYGVIKAVTINHGGKTNGYTVPNPNAQEEVIRTALRKAKMKATDYSYIEAHGTGTKLGDPIEINALNRVFESYDAPKQGCAIGTVKSNIGHTEATAGIASITKVLLQMKYQKLVPSIYGMPFNSNIDFDKSYFQYQGKQQDWNPMDDYGNPKARIAGISSFGAGGANGHIIISEYLNKDGTNDEDSEQIIVLSAKTEEVIKENAKRLATFVESQKFNYYTLANIAWTLQIGRDEMKHRLAFCCKSKNELIQKLKWVAAGKEFEQIFSGIVKRGKYEEAATNDPLQICQEWVNGTTINWKSIQREKAVRVVPLPSYAFLRERYWVPVTEREAKVKQTEKLHPYISKNISTFTCQRYETVIEEDMCEKGSQGISILSQQSIQEILLAAASLSSEKNYNFMQTFRKNPQAEVLEGKTVVTSLYDAVSEIECEAGYQNHKDEYVIIAQGTIKK